MAKKKNTIPEGFENILNNIYDNPANTHGVTDMDDLDVFEDLPVDEIKNEPPVNTEDGNEEPVEDKTPQPEEPKQEEIKTPQEPPIDNNENDEPTEEDMIEAQQVGLLFDAVGQSLGWNMADVAEENRPLTVDQLTNFLAETVRQNSIPEYADERIQALDEYVRNGGKFEDYYTRQSDALSLDNIDMEDESNQKAVIKELLKQSNYSDEQINKKIARYEDNDMLYEESEDALDRLKQIRTAQLEEQRRMQEEMARQQEEESRQFFQSVTNEINSLTNIRGIAIPKEDRKALFDYIFKVDKDGITQYQKDFAKNQSKNLIESAYFTMKADALISSAKHTGETSASEKLRKLLRHTSKNHSMYNADEKQKSVTDLLVGAF